MSIGYVMWYLVPEEEYERDKEDRASKKSLFGWCPNAELN
jgi:hypothetical protein